MSPRRLLALPIPRITQNLVAKIRVGLVVIGSLLLAGSTTWAQKFTEAPPLSAGKALVYVYRKGGMLGALGHPLVFVNEYFLAQLHNSNYAPLEVPQGPVVVTATVAIQDPLVAPSSTGFWATLPGCAGVDWRRLALELPADVALCSTEFIKLEKECGLYTESGYFYRVADPSTYRLRTVIPACNYKVREAGSLSYLLNVALNSQKLLRPPLRFEGEAGKTYYVRWSVSRSGGKMELVDAAEGAKQIEGLKLAPDRGADTPTVTSGFSEAAREGNLEKIKAVLKDNPDLALGKDANGMTPLHFAAANGHKDVSEVLLSGNATVSARNTSGQTPLHYAAAGDHRDVVELLLAHGADVNAKDELGETPLYQALYIGHKDLVELLLASHADVNAQERLGMTPLDAAAFNGYKDVAELLLSAGAAVSVRDMHGQTPLHYAALGGHRDIAELLLAHGADVNAKDNADITPLRHAIFGSSEGHKEVAELLRQHGGHK